MNIYDAVAQKATLGVRPANVTYREGGHWFLYEESEALAAFRAIQFSDGTIWDTVIHKWRYDEDMKLPLLIKGGPSGEQNTGNPVKPYVPGERYGIYGGITGDAVKGYSAPLATEGTALTKQIGGTHYRDMVIQPVTYILANKISFPEGNVIKYVSRWRAKGGVQDLKKALHHLQLLIEHVERTELNGTI